MRSIPLQQFKKGYRKTSTDLGYKQTSARPWQIGDLRTALLHMLQKAKNLKGLPAVMLARDGFILAVLWQTSSRGCNAGAWRLDNVKLPTGAESYPPRCEGPIMLTACTATLTWGIPVCRTDSPPLSAAQAELASGL